MPFVIRESEFLYIHISCDVLKQAIPRKLFENNLRNIAISHFYNNKWEFIRRPSANSCDLTLERRMHCQSGSNLFFGLHNIKCFAILPS